MAIGASASRVERAGRISGVVGVWSGQDLAVEFGSVPRISTRVSYRADVTPYLQPVLATDRVRYVGEPIAIVVASDRYVAEDAADLVFVDLDPLPVVTDAHEPLSPETLFPEGNHVTTLEAHSGDPDGAFTGADIIVECELAIGRHSGVPMETRAPSRSTTPTATGS